MALVQNSAFSFTGVLNKIEQYIVKSGETLFSKDSFEYLCSLFLIHRSF